MPSAIIPTHAGLPHAKTKTTILHNSQPQSAGTTQLPQEAHPSATPSMVFQSQCSSASLSNDRQVIDSGFCSNNGSSAVLAQCMSGVPPEAYTATRQSVEDSIEAVARGHSGSSGVSYSVGFACENVIDCPTNETLSVLATERLIANPSILPPNGRMVDLPTSHGTYPHADERSKSSAAPDTTRYIRDAHDDVCLSSNESLPKKLNEADSVREDKPNEDVDSSSQPLPSPSPFASSSSSLEEKSHLQQEALEAARAEIDSPKNQESDSVPMWPTIRPETAPGLHNWYEECLPPLSVSPPWQAWLDSGVSRIQPEVLNTSPMHSTSDGNTKTGIHLLDASLCSESGSVLPSQYAAVRLPSEAAVSSGGNSSESLSTRNRTTLTYSPETIDKTISRNWAGVNGCELSNNAANTGRLLPSGHADTFPLSQSRGGSTDLVSGKEILAGDLDVGLSPCSGVETRERAGQFTYNPLTNEQWRSGLGPHESSSRSLKVTDISDRNPGSTGDETDGACVTESAQLFYGWRDRFVAQVGPRLEDGGALACSTVSGLKTDGVTDNNVTTEPNVTAADHGTARADVGQLPLVTAVRREVLVLPYVDVGIPDFVEYDYPEPERYSMPRFLGPTLGPPATSLPPPTR
jgi:hypothetical protein